MSEDHQFVTNAEDHDEEVWTCPRCRETIHGIRWNGKCRDCHEDTCLYSLDGDLVPEGFDPLFAGERWDDDY